MQNTMPQIPLGRPATYDDLVALPEHVVGEIVDDELWASPRPAPRHAASHSSLLAAVHSAFSRGPTRPDGWLILLEPELHLGRHVLVPDLAGWRIERLPRLPDTAYFTVAPDWVCEVLSPSTAALDRAKKLRIYGESGVDHAWFVDPVTRVLEVMRCTAGQWTLIDTHAGAAVVNAIPFESLALDLATLWYDDPPAGPGPP